MVDRPDIPAPLVGVDGDEPQYWAQSAQTHGGITSPFKAGRLLSEDSESLLGTMRTLAARREPALRRFISGEEFKKMVGRKSANVEALMAQVVGTKWEGTQRCSHCRGPHKSGPFASCVSVPALKDRMLECGNCRWGYRGERCSFRTEPPYPISETETRTLLQLGETNRTDTSQTDPPTAPPTTDPQLPKHEDIEQLEHDIAQARKCRDSAEEALASMVTTVNLQRKQIQHQNERIQCLLERKARLQQKTR